MCEFFIIFRSLREEYIQSDNDSAVFFEIIDHSSIVVPFEVLESSESFGIGKGFIVDSDDRNGIIGGSIASKSRNEDITDSEIRLFYENSCKIGGSKEGDILNTDNSDDTENNRRNNRRNNEFVLEIIFGFYFCHMRER